jgi:DNA-binding transcriptional MerR regulator
MSTTNGQLVKPYTAKELAALYGVSTKTLRTWLQPHQDAVGKKVSRYFTALQIQVIFEKLGVPSVPE